MNRHVKAMRWSGIVALFLLYMTCSGVAQPSDTVGAIDDTRDAQQDKFWYGGFAHLLLNDYNADISRLPGVPNCCNSFMDGNGIGFGIGALAGYRLSDLLALELRGGYLMYGGTLSAMEGTTVILDSQEVAASFEHLLETNLATLSLEPLLVLTPVKDLSLKAGISSGFVVSKAFDQREELREPADRGTFENDSRTRNIRIGDIPQVSSLLTSLLFGVGYDLPLNKRGTWIATPEAFYSIGLTPIVQDSTWSVNSIRLGVSVRYSSAPPLPVAPPPFPVLADDPPPLPDADLPMLAASVTAEGVDAEGNTLPLVRINVEEFISTHMRPLLNYVFFAEGSSALPDRYTRLTPEETEDFSAERLFNIPTIPTYHHILNIIGQRMLEHPEAAITLVGTNIDRGVEQNNLALSRDRAETVRNYLRDIWRIDTSRIAITFRALPEKPSNMERPDGVEENRRVEVYSDTWEILEPVVTNDTLRTVDPPVIRYSPAVIAEGGLAEWTLKVMQGDVLLKEFSGKRSVPSRVEWNIEQEQGSIPRTDEPLIYTLTATDLQGQTATSQVQSMDVEQLTIQTKRRERIADKEIDRYSLILFDFDRADVAGANTRISKFIRDNISEEAEVTITGYTDRIGEEDYNRRLSERRAKSTAESLEEGEADVSGLGESVELYDNNLPEGRFYSRTVNVIVETPIKE